MICISAVFNIMYDTGREPSNTSELIKRLWKTAWWDAALGDDSCACDGCTPRLSSAIVFLTSRQVFPWCVYTSGNKPSFKFGSLKADIASKGPAINRGGKKKTCRMKTRVNGFSFAQTNSSKLYNVFHLEAERRMNHQSAASFRGKS